MASIVLKKRNFNQMVESSILVEEPMLAPKRYLDDQGKLANSFTHYIERLSIIFPELSPQQLSAELTSNGNDVLATIENLRSRAKSRASNKFNSNLAETTNLGNSKQSEEDQVLLSAIDETLTELTQCQNSDSARRSLYKFAKKIKGSTNSSFGTDKEKKLVAENEILKQAFKILQKQLLSSKEDNEKLTGALAHTQSETETLKKNNYLLAMRVKSLEMGTSGNLLFGNRDVY
jgi:hypothetical protein